MGLADQAFIAASRSTLVPGQAIRWGLPDLASPGIVGHPDPLGSHRCNCQRRIVGMSDQGTSQEHSILGQATLFLAILVVGVMWTLDAAGLWDLPEQVAWATGLGILGAGLLVGAFVGRARWLVWICIPVLFLLAAAGSPSRAVMWPSSTNVGDRQWRPLTVAELPDEYVLGVGTGVLDLTGLDLPRDPVAVIPVQARVDMGTLEVRLPASARAEIDARAGMGTIDIVGSDQRTEGMDQDLLITLPGRPGFATLDLTLSVGMGTVEVSRAATSS